MKKRRSATYIQPATLSDLRRIVTDHENFPDTTRIWVHGHAETAADPTWYSIEVSHAEEHK
jgi:hypothetical protein